MATMAVGFAGGMAAVALVTATLPPDAAEAWGWRIPFLLAVPLGVVVLLLRRRTPETPAYHELRNMRGGTGGRRFPSRALRRERATVVQGFFLTAGLMSSFTLWFVYLPAHLAATGVFALHVLLASSLFGLLVAAASALICGHASDRWGRRAVIISGLVAVGISWTLGYPPLARGFEAALLPAYLVAGAGLGGLVVQSTLSEAFPLPVRVAGLAVSFGMASAVVGGTSPFVADLLMRISSTSVQFYALTWLAAAAGGTVLLTRPRLPGVREAASGLPPSKMTRVE